MVVALYSDDPRLTAYALGELGPAEAAALTAELDAAAGARQAVAEIRALAKTLATVLQSEPCPALTPEQREAIRAAAEPKLVRLPQRRPYRPVLKWVAAAAAVLLLSLLAFGVLKRGQKAVDKEHDPSAFMVDQPPVEKKKEPGELVDSTRVARAEAVIRARRVAPSGPSEFGPKIRAVRFEVLAVVKNDPVPPTMRPKRALARQSIRVKQEIEVLYPRTQQALAAIPQGEMTLYLYTCPFGKIWFLNGSPKHGISHTGKEKVGDYEAEEAF